MTKQYTLDDAAFVEARDLALHDNVSVHRGVHYLVRRASVVLARRRADAQANRLNICRDILLGDLSSLEGTELAEHYRLASRKHQHYLLGALYVLLMPSRRRQRLAAYFTPPAISEYVVSRLIEFGFDPAVHTALDPACGGAAFLVPIAEKMFASSEDPKSAADGILGRLTGIEIEPGLAALSDLLIADALGKLGTSSSAVVQRGSALRSPRRGEQYDLIVGNPPYGRVFRPKPELLNAWQEVITDGHVNTYSLFVGLSLRLARPGGLVALLIPTSFTGGPYFSRLRAAIRRVADVIRLDLIDKRSDEFLDVTQDTCVLFLRRRDDSSSESREAPRSALIGPSGAARELGTIRLPTTTEGEWVLPEMRDAPRIDDVFSRTHHYTLQDYGYEARSGYFVWNRSRDYFENRDVAHEGEVPLIWANGIRSGQPIEPASRPLSGKLAGAVTFVRITSSSVALIRHPSVVLQRTTNRRQPRRLVAGYVNQDLIDVYGGYVTENHTIVLVPKTLFAPEVTPMQLAALLSSEVVDGLYRRISGTVSVSTKLLRRLPLPNPTAYLASLAQTNDTEEAVNRAYAAN
ncbi:HsdM family class I SAM-dependent methyltransferase [Devosia sp. CN2-171]|uniref:HsdM family class I SAM-dependent methyltransferase n=1 Tax=Devosia sp. CN2-171 TaxID=3400909 RepID=UPI003BF7D937